MPDVSVLIASVGRSSLARCVRSVQAAAAFAGVECEIIVADDSETGAAAAALDAAELRGAVRVLAVAARNISEARNACLDAASAARAVFIDDDEWAERDWLERLTTAMDEFSADAVFGSVRAQYSEAAPAWLTRSDPFSKNPGRRGAAVAFGSTCNVLIRMTCVRSNGLRFDPAFGRTGGEDTDFFHRLHTAGGRLIAADDAVVHERVPPSRTSRAYLRRRAMSGGYMFADVSLRGASASARGLFAASAIAKWALANTVYAALWPISRSRAVPWAISVWSNAGKLSRTFGAAAPERY